MVSCAGGTSNLLLLIGENEDNTVQNIMKVCGESSEELGSHLQLTEDDFHIVERSSSAT